MRARHAREIRRGILLARMVIARKRVGPRSVWGDTLWEIAYIREMAAAARDGRIRPPRGPSGVSRAQR